MRTSVADVLRAAGVSRETFYEQFTSKEDCFMAAYDAAVEVLLAAIPAAAAPTAPRGGLRARPRAPTWTRWPPSRSSRGCSWSRSTPPAPRRSRAGCRRRSASSTRCRDLDAAGAERFAVEALVAAIAQMVTARLAVGDIDGLRALHGPLTDLVGTARWTPMAEPRIPPGSRRRSGWSTRRSRGCSGRRRAGARRTSSRRSRATAACSVGGCASPAR